MRPAQSTRSMSSSTRHLSLAGQQMGISDLGPWKQAERLKVIQNNAAKGGYKTLSLESSKENHMHRGNDAIYSFVRDLKYELSFGKLIQHHLTGKIAGEAREAS